MAYSPEMRDKAKELFLTPDIDGKHKYTNKDISIELARLYPEDTPPNPSTILRWTKKPDESGYSWRDLWQAAIQSAIVNSIPDKVRANVSKEEAIMDSLEQFQSLLAGLGMELVTKGRRYFKGKEYVPKNNYEAITMIQAGVAILNQQKGQLTPRDVQFNIKILEIGEDEAERDVTDEVRVITQEDKDSVN